MHFTSVGIVLENNSLVYLGRALDYRGQRIRGMLSLNLGRWFFNMRFWFLFWNQNLILAP